MNDVNDKNLNSTNSNDTYIPFINKFINNIDIDIIKKMTNISIIYDDDNYIFCVKLLDINNILKYKLILDIRKLFYISFTSDVIHYLQKLEDFYFEVEIYPVWTFNV